MKEVCNTIILVLILTLQSCQVYVTDNGRKHRQLFPAKDKSIATALDTSRFVRKPFQYPASPMQDGKRVVMPVTGEDLGSLITAQDRYYLYFWDPTCKGALLEAYKFDSLSRQGLKVLIISLRKTYEAIDRNLSKTTFFQQPYYVIEDGRYSETLLLKKIRFMKDLCNDCYERYKDDLAVADYIVIGKGSVDVVMYNDEDNNVLRK